MNPEQMRARLVEIAAMLGQFSSKEGNLTNEEVTSVNALNEEFETLTQQIEAKEKIEAMNAKLQQTNRQIEPAPVAKIQVGVDRVVNDPKKGFKAAGEFYSAVIGSKNGNPDQRLVKAGLMEKFGEDGGFLIPDDFRSNIQKKVTGDESLLARCTQFVTSSNTLTLPIHEVAPWDATAGIQAYWDGEGAAHTYSKDKFGEMSMRLHKLTAMVKITDELMEDAPLLESWVNSQAPQAILHKINSAIIKGSGAGMPLGILNSLFKKKVNKEGGQAADSVVFENINKMLGALNPTSLSRAVWVLNPAILPLLRLMTFGTGGANPVPVYLPATGVSGAPFGSLFGLPILPMMGGVRAVGDEGDLMLVDFAYYFAAVKSGGIKQSMSTHVYFETSENALKFTQRIAGQVPYKAPITNEAGDYVCSGIVTLEDRA